MAEIPAIRARYAALSGHLDERGRRIFAATEAETAGYGGIAAVVRATGIAASTMDERGRRIFAATEAETAGYGGIAAVVRATGIAASTIGRGLKDLAAADALDLGRVRRPGGGGKTRLAQDPTLLADLLALVEPDARGDPMSPLRWACKSLSQLARALTALGHRVGRTLVGELLKQQKFSLQANCKTREGSSHADHDAQFRHMNESVRAALTAGEPVILVDTKKKELVGDFKNPGRAWRPQGDPEDVRVHDFLIKELGRAVPYGIYDLACNAGWVGVGMSCDTSAFAVQTIRRWWQEMGQVRYPRAKRLTITADARIASPGMLPSADPLPHLECSRPGFGGDRHEADQHGDA